MHTIHHSRAVILKSHGIGESNKMFWLFTEELGLVRAIATGVRKPASKLRGQLSDYSFITVDLVRGKDVWRLISAKELYNPLAQSSRHALARPYVRTLATLERFLIDEGVHQELFAHIWEVGKYLEAHQAKDRDSKLFDTFAIWRTLVHLGYIPQDEDIKVPFTEALEKINDKKMKQMIIVVNKTIKETHL